VDIRLQSHKADNASMGWNTLKKKVMFFHVGDVKWAQKPIEVRNELLVRLHLLRGLNDHRSNGDFKREYETHQLKMLYGIVEKIL
jgi:hypothetical protein